MTLKKIKLKKKIDIIYCRFFLHAISEKSEKKLLNLIKNISKDNTLVFFEFRNWHDEIFDNKRKNKNNDIVEFEKGHYRRIIDPKIFIKVFSNKITSKILYFKSSKNLSIVKKDNPHLSRIIFRIN